MNDIHDKYFYHFYFILADVEMMVFSCRFWGFREPLIVQMVDDSQCQKNNHHWQNVEDENHVKSLFKVMAFSANTWFEKQRLRDFLKKLRNVSLNLRLRSNFNSFSVVASASRELMSSSSSLRLPSTSDSLVTAEVASFRSKTWPLRISDSTSEDTAEDDDGGEDRNWINSESHWKQQNEVRKGFA